MYNPGSEYTACICCAGPLQAPARARRIAAGAQLLIAADGGAGHLFSMGLKPHAIIGDADSLCRDPWMDDSTIRRVVFPANKDRTDTELAVEWALDQGAGRLLLLAAAGGRLDHTLGNSALLIRFAGRVELWDNGVLARAVTTGQRADLQTDSNTTVSLIPFTPDTRITTRGLRYALTDQTLQYATHGLSNTALTGRCSIEVNHGVLVCLYDQQQNPSP